MDDRKSIFPLVKGVLIMGRRMILNGTSYFGQGAIQEIVTEVNNHHFKKVLVATDPDLIKFGVDEMDQETYRQAAIDAIQQLADDVEIPRSLRDVGAKEEDIPFLAESAFNDACTPGNPRDCTLEEIADIYKSMFR